MLLAINHNIKIIFFVTANTLDYDTDQYKPRFSKNKQKNQTNMVFQRN